MELRQLRALVAVAEESSIRQAARRLFIAQPSLSQTIRSLEHEVGVELFVRSTRGVELTPAGLTLYNHACDILSRIDAAVELTRSEVESELRIGLVAGRFAAADLTGPLVSSFAKAHPNTRIELVELNMGEQAAPLVDGVVDIALVRAPIELTGVELFPLIAEPRSLIFSPDHPLADATEISNEELLSMRMLSMERCPAEWGAFWRLDELRNNERPERSKPVNSVTVDEVELAVLLDPDVVMTAASSVPRLSNVGMLKSLPLPDVPPSIVSAARRTNDSRPAVTQFIAHSQTFCREAASLSPGAVCVAEEPISA